MPLAHIFYHMHDGLRVKRHRISLTETFDTVVGGEFDKYPVATSEMGWGCSHYYIKFVRYWGGYYHRHPLLEHLSVLHAQVRFTNQGD